MSLTDVTRELLVRYLDVWTPAALHAGRRATFVEAWSGADAADASLRVLAEFGDRLRGRQLTMVVVAADPGGLPDRLAALQDQLGTPAGLAVYTMAGDPAERLPAALVATGAAGAPLLVCLETDGDPPLRPVTAGRPGELLLVTPAGQWPARRAALRAAGFPLTAGVELVAEGEPPRLLAFAAAGTKSLQAFKEQLWSVDEYAGVRLRDPADPAGELLDISLTPHPGPLRRALLAFLAGGPATVTQLRDEALTATVYRAADAVRVLTGLLEAGAVTRHPAGGRLGGDVVIELADRSG
jgi:hypothetical protein